MQQYHETWLACARLLQVFSAVAGGGSGAGLLLLLTELTGLYAISTILLIRKQLPPKYRRAWRCHCLPYCAGCIAGLLRTAPG
jgi:hypothetical protein